MFSNVNIKNEKCIIKTETNADSTISPWVKANHEFLPEEADCSQTNVTSPQLGNFEFVSRY